MNKALIILLSAGVLSVLTASAQVAAGEEAKPPPKVPELDAKYVKMKIPRAVLTDQVFSVAITVKNTGALAWREGHRQPGTITILLSQDPEGNATWGTRYIIQGQGTVVEPGKEFTFRSSLKAPSTPGEYSFQWKLKARGATFGEATARETIKVEKRAEEAPAVPPKLPPPDETGKRVLTFEDFEYLGSFRVPRKVGSGGAGYSESGLAFRRMKDGTRRLFMNYPHPRGTLFEVEIPAPVKIAGGNFARLKVAAVKKVWGPIGMKVPKTGGVTAIAPLGGFWWDEARRTLYWTWYHGYWTGGALPMLAACRLNVDGTITYLGPWTVANQKWFWGGVIKLSQGFAKKYTGGRTLALGFGGYYSICGPCSRGPALGAISEPDPAKKSVDVVTLLGYARGAKAPRDGNYFSANCGFWYDPPKNAKKGHWTFNDYCRGGVFIDLPDKHAYIAFVRLGTGRLGYDYGAINSAGRAQYWYFYDPRDLGKVAKQTRKPGAVLPYLMTKDSAVIGGKAVGSCFDEKERTLYIFRMWAYPVGREQHPLVHMYRVKKAADKNEAGGAK